MQNKPTIDPIRNKTQAPTSAISNGVESPIKCLPYMNVKLEHLLHKIGVKTIRDLLFYAPSRYLDFSNIVKIENLKIGETATIQGKIFSIKNIRTWKKKINITEALIRDDTGQAKAVWFNQPFLTRNLREGNVINLSGKFISDKNGAYLQNPSYEQATSYKLQAASSPIHTAGLAAVYPETKGLTSRWIRLLISRALKFASQIPEILPPDIRKKENFPPIGQVIKNLHFPSSFESAEKAKRQLAFQELLVCQLAALDIRRQIKSQASWPIKIDIALIKNFLSQLPFALTGAQKKSAWQALKDMGKSTPMNRLLSGDVGSGKTIVAAIAALSAAKDDFQVAYLAPTEILARQHFETFNKFLRPFNLNIALLTGPQSKIFKPELNETYGAKKTEMSKKISDGKINIAIGTHALLQDKINFNRLGLVIIDEQHRFGVSQRAKLLQSNQLPHFLSMTATPIPRTLMLTVFGDLDISTIRELPPGRQKIITKIVLPDDRQNSYKFMRQEIKNGRQAFVICPRIEQSNETQNQNIKLETKTVKEEYSKLSEKIFPDLKIAMLHGKMKAKEKEETMNKFKNNETNILISTSVIEVGMDIPNASVMMIEGADRFGLAQLHQFRGRIGRGHHQSYCFLMADSENKLSNERLRALIKSDNGFELAERDLELRGPGDFLGSRQSGMPDLIFASSIDIFLLEKTRKYAADILSKDPGLKYHPLLKNQVQKIQKETHLE